MPGETTSGSAELTVRVCPVERKIEQRTTRTLEAIMRPNSLQKRIEKKKKNTTQKQQQQH